jgi:hypothetical protein
MRFQTLDNIVRSALMQKSYPIHFYLQGLKSASDCLRELTFDSLRNINTIMLPVSATGTIDIPCDCVDMIKVGVPTGQYVKPLVKKDTINRLPDLNSSGQPINYPAPDNVDLTYIPFLLQSDYFTDDYEPLGRFFGFSADWLTDGYKVIRERGIIQIDQSIADPSIYLEYISDGQSSDNATMIHPYAQKTIEAYIFWQFKEHSRSYSPTERQLAQKEFESQRRTLRARLNGLTKDDYVRIVRTGYSATIKG